jgi:hypothetical protein
LHATPFALAVELGTPPSQTSSVQELPSSTGTQSAPPVPLLLVTVLLEDDEAEPPPLEEDDDAELPSEPPPLEEDDDAELPSEPPPPEEQATRSRLAISKKSKATAGSGRAELRRIRASGRSRRFLRQFRQLQKKRRGDVPSGSVDAHGHRAHPPSRRCLKRS